jgi:alpha-methylacyl-CoA racemase
MGPLSGIKVVEFEGLGPTPFAAMMLADLGADVIRIDRPAAGGAQAGDPSLDALARLRRSIVLDLKSVADRDAALMLVATADALIEGNRPGVMERLGLGPGACHAANPRLVYARMTGWGQEGPLAGKAGHDINYIAQAGALHPIGPADAPPPPPLNLIGDFGGGALFAVTGILAALVERTTSRAGQVVDAAMVDGAALLTAQLHGWRAMGFWSDARGANLLDGAAYFYRCYDTADGRYMAVGAIEPQFHRALIAGLGLDLADFADQMDRRHWRARSDRLAAVFAARTRDAWVEVFRYLDACVSPVLTPAEALVDPANTARDMFRPVGSHRQPAPAPRFSRTPCADPTPPDPRGASGVAIRADWGIAASD